MRSLTLLALVALELGHATGDGAAEAPAAFDGATNGLVDQATHDADREAFDEVEVLADGLGPIYNAQSCRECHQNPASGGISQITELRAGHRDASGRFANPSVPVANGAAVITGRTLINDRAICPSAALDLPRFRGRVRVCGPSQPVALVVAGFRHAASVCEVRRRGRLAPDASASSPGRRPVRGAAPPA